MPLKETIQISADTLYNSKFVPPAIPKAVFTEIQTADTTSVELIFNNTMHKQIGGAVMGSPLGQVLSIYLLDTTKRIVPTNQQTHPIFPLC